MTRLIRWATTDRDEQAEGVPSVRDLLTKGWRASGPHPTRPTMWLMSVEVEDDTDAPATRTCPLWPHQPGRRAGDLFALGGACGQSSRSLKGRVLWRREI